MRLISKSSLLQAEMEVFIQFNGEQTFAWVWRHIGYRRWGHIYMAVFPGLTASCVTMATIRCHFNTPPSRVNTQLGIKGSLPDCFGWFFTDKRFVSVLFLVRPPFYMRLNHFCSISSLFCSTLWPLLHPVATFPPQTHHSLYGTPERRDRYIVIANSVSLGYLW